MSEFPTGVCPRCQRLTNLYIKDDMLLCAVCHQNETESAILSQKQLASMGYKDARDVLIRYLKHKVELCDWHGVSDAANDLRVLEAEQVGREKGALALELELNTPIVERGIRLKTPPSV